MGGVNGTPQPDRHSKLGAKPLGTAGSGGAAGSSCAVLPDPTTLNAADTLLAGLTAAALVAVTVWAVVALIAWRARGDR